MEEYCCETTKEGDPHGKFAFAFAFPPTVRRLKLMGLRVRIPTYYLPPPPPAASLLYCTLFTKSPDR